ncbi:unnamed protein product [Gulo gulo]|uniref:Uncharacterized protein n=1 Tax=Gulo gulo TaxID=48420 RepID=A0A9X9MBQ6_GULGU|nr:unnamed protein product [Gulo gulo]
MGWKGEKQTLSVALGRTQGKRTGTLSQGGSLLLPSCWLNQHQPTSQPLCHRMLTLNLSRSVPNGE